MHYFDREHHMYGGHAIVGGARAARRRDGVRFEDIATKIASRFASSATARLIRASFHEALNLAALYKLPVVFICENNLFAMGTSVERSTSLKQIVDRAEGYDIPGTVIDGMNFREVRDKLTEDHQLDPRRIRIRHLWKSALTVIAATPCPIRRVIGRRNSSNNIGSTIRSRVCARSSPGKEN